MGHDLCCNQCAHASRLLITSALFGLCVDSITYTYCIMRFAPCLNACSSLLVFAPLQPLQRGIGDCPHLRAAIYVYIANLDRGKCSSCQCGIRAHQGTHHDASYATSRHLLAVGLSHLHAARTQMQPRRLCLTWMVVWPSTQRFVVTSRLHQGPPIVSFLLSRVVLARCDSENVLLGC